MNTEPSPELPWGEAQWEQMMRESDVRSARFGDLLETLIDHPDRDAIIAREMGWDREPRSSDEFDDDPVFDSSTVGEAIEEPTDVDGLTPECDDVDDIPAYAESFAWSMRVHHALKGKADGRDDDLDELAGEAVGSGHTIAAKIAGGHGMGYDDDAICGNIVNCKRALEAADISMLALKELSDACPDLKDVIRPLIADGREVRRLVVERIDELRSRVWWE